MQARFLTLEYWQIDPVHTQNIVYGMDSQAVRPLANSIGTQHHCVGTWGRKVRQETMTQEMLTGGVGGWGWGWQADLEQGPEAQINMEKFCLQRTSYANATDTTMGRDPQSPYEI
jgi:hypothetical protein